MDTTAEWRLPTVDTPDTERNDLLPRFRPTRRLMTGKEFEEIANSDPLTILPWILVPDGIGDLAPPVMQYGIDIVPEMLVAYAVEHDIVAYYDESPTCSEFEFDEDQDDDDEEDQGEPEQDGHDEDQHDNQHELVKKDSQDDEHKDGQEGPNEKGEEAEKVDAEQEEEDEEDEEEEENKFRPRPMTDRPRKTQPEIDRIESMQNALYALIREMGLCIPLRLVKFALGVQRLAVRDTSMIASFYSNYDLKANDLPRTEDIEKLRTAVGSQHPPGWYLDRSNLTWERYY